MAENDDDLYLAIDQGGHASRAIVFSADRNIIASFYREIDTVQDVEDRVEHDAAEFIQSIRDVLIDLQRGLPPEQLANIKSAGLATQRSSIACWRKSDSHPLSPIISWQDRRTENQLAPYRQYDEIIRHKTGLLLNAHYGATKMRWCLDNIEEVRQAAQRNDLAMAPVASFILSQLCISSSPLVDPANAGRTLLFDYATGDWDDELLEIFGINRSILPDCVHSQYPFGKLQLGDYAIPVTLCTGDQSAAVFAFGMPDKSTLYCNAGTGAFVQQVLAADEQQKVEGLLRSIVYSDAEKCLLVQEGTVNGAGRALQWYAEQQGVEDYVTMLDRPLDDVPAFINGVSGLGSPFWYSSLVSEFDRECDVREGFVAILESIVFLLCCNIELFEGVQDIVVSGGLSNNSLFCQSLADLSGYPVRRFVESEATAKGVFFLLSGVSMRTRAERIFLPQKNHKLTHRYSHWNKLLSLRLG